MPPQSHFIPSTKGQTFPVEVLTKTEMHTILGQCSRRAPSGIRNRALFTVMYRAGLRLQEALDLQVRDVDLDVGSINVRRGKGGRQRIVGIDRDALPVVEQWLTERKRLGLSARGVLFCQITKGKLGGILDPSYVRHALKRAAARAGVDKRVHPHALRHSMSSEMAAEGTPIHFIQGQLGHTSLATTDRYLRKVAPHELVKVMQARTWMDNSA